MNFFKGSLVGLPDHKIKGTNIWCTIERAVNAKYLLTWFKIKVKPIAIRLGSNDLCDKFAIFLCKTFTFCFTGYKSQSVDILAVRAL